MLTDDSYLVPPPTEHTPFAAAQRVMARWSNGEDHVRRRSIAVDALAGVDLAVLRRRSAAMARSELEHLAEPLDVMPLARLVPVAVLAEALGFPDPCAAARDVTGLVVAASGEEAINRAALLLQCDVATAAWIAAALLGSGPPFRHTVRMRAGESVHVPLAALPFGDGAHACPGRAHALALADGVLEAITAAGLRPVPGQTIDFEDRPNVWLPLRLQMSKRHPPDIGRVG